MAIFKNNLKSKISNNLNIKNGSLKGFLVLFLFLIQSFSIMVSAQVKLSDSDKSKTSGNKSKLVLVLVYDQFRADMLTRFKEKFQSAIAGNGKVGGFRYLIEKGAYYPFAEYEVLQSMTCPGHAMILTGSYPYNNGIPLNDWYDRESKKLVYCADDKEFGLSPKQLRGTTVGDELKLISPNSKIMGVALKDRSSIMLAGHAADLAVWFNRESMSWVTSKYYQGRTDLTWLDNLNKKVSVLSGAEVQWNPSFTKHKFSYKAKATSDEALAFPFGNQLTNQAAIELLKANKLGQRGVTDILAISFSTHDLVGHRYGPDSPETEEMTLHEDYFLAELLNEVKKQVPGGLKNVDIVLTADHGTAPVVEYAKKMGIDAGRINQEELMARLNAYLTDKFGTGSGESGKWFSAYKSFNFFLSKENYEKLKNNGKEFEVLSKAKDWLLRQEGIAFVVTASDYRERVFLPEMHGRQTTKSYIPGINGDILIIPRPNWYEVSKMPGIHMTGYTYDRTVPLIFVGQDFKPGVYGQIAHVVDLAPTLSFVLGQMAPSLSEGRVLHESLNLKSK